MSKRRLMNFHIIYTVNNRRYFYNVSEAILFNTLQRYTFHYMEGVALKVTRRVRVLMEKVKASQPTENFE